MSVQPQSASVVKTCDQGGGSHVAACTPAGVAVAELPRGSALCSRTVSSARQIVAESASGLLGSTAVADVDDAAVARCSAAGEIASSVAVVGG